MYSLLKCLVYRTFCPLYEVPVYETSGIRKMLLAVSYTGHLVRYKRFWYTKCLVYEKAFACFVYRTSCVRGLTKLGDIRFNNSKTGKNCKTGLKTDLSFYRFPSTKPEP